LTLTFELGRDFCTVHLTAKFHHPTFDHSEVIMQTNKLTNKQTDTAENIHFASLLVTISTFHPLTFIRCSGQSQTIAPYFYNILLSKLIHF